MYVDFFEKMDDYRSYLLANLSREVPTVEILVGQGQVTFLKGPEYAVKYLMYLVLEEERRTELAYSDT